MNEITAANILEIFDRLNKIAVTGVSNAMVRTRRDPILIGRNERAGVSEIAAGFGKVDFPLPAKLKLKNRVGGENDKRT